MTLNSKVMLRAWTVLSKKWVIATSIASITFVNISVAHSNAYGVGSLNSNTLFQQQNTTLTGIVTVQPVFNVYVIVAMLAVPPVTIPEASTVATSELLVLHVPLGVGSESVIEDPEQTVFPPAIAAGRGFTVTIVATVQLVPIV